MRFNRRKRLWPLRRIHRTALYVPLWAASLIWPGSAAAQALEYEVKAAFLLNFTKFIDWPPSAFASSDSPFAICVFGKDPFGRALDDIIQGEAVNNRGITVRRIDQAPGPQTCQVVFFGISGKEVPEILKSLGSGVLSVADGDNFIREGGMIAFVIDNRRVRFDINQGAAEKAGLKLSSKLLTVARSVEK